MKQWVYTYVNGELVDRKKIEMTFDENGDFITGRKEMAEFGQECRKKHDKTKKKKKAPDNPGINGYG